MARGPLRISRQAHPRTIKHLGPGTLDFALRSVRGGKRAIMEELAPMALRFEPRLGPAITTWRQLTPWQRRGVTLDDLATGADLTGGEFLAAVVRAGFEATHQLADLLVACAFPSVVTASIKRAQTVNGLADRQLLFEHMSACSMSMALEQAAEKPRHAAGNTDAASMEPDYLRFFGTDRGDSRGHDPG